MYIRFISCKSIIIITIYNTSIYWWMELRKINIAQIWVFIFKHLKKKNIVYEEINIMVEFTLNLPGLYASTEQVFIISLSFGQKIILSYRSLHLNCY